jgi:hypothetical protein
MKSDIENAYKLIPNEKSQVRLYGMKWLGKYWVDTSTVFGSAAAPATFDALPATLVNITCTMENIPTNRVFRQLDDVPVLGIASSGEVGRFYKRYKQLCHAVNVPLAPRVPSA